MALSFWLQQREDYEKLRKQYLSTTWSDHHTSILVCSTNYGIATYENSWFHPWLFPFGSKRNIMRHCACATCQQLDQLTMHPSCVCVCVAQTMPSLPMRMVLPALQTSLSLGFAYLYCFRALQSSSKYIDKPYTRQAVAYLYCLHLLGFLRVSHQCLA